VALIAWLYSVIKLGNMMQDDAVIELENHLVTLKKSLAVDKTSATNSQITEDTDVVLN
jgi:hypothetical protein